MRLSLAWKLLLGYFFMVILAGLISGMSILEMNRMQQSTDNIVQDAIPVSNAARDILTQLVNEETAVRGYLITADEAYLQPYKLGKQAIQADLQILDAHATNHPIMQQLIKEARPTIEAIERFSESLIRQVEDGTSSQLQAQRRVGDGKRLMDKFRATFEKMAADSDKLIQDAWNQAHAARQQAMIVVLATLAFTLVAGLAVGIYLARSISRPVRLVAAATKRVADGDLTVAELRVRSRDEVGQMARDFNRMVASLRGIMQEVSQAAQAVFSASEELAAASGQSVNGAQSAAAAVDQMAGRAMEQAASADGARTTMEQLQQTIRQIATGSQQTAVDMQHSAQLLGQMVTAIEGVATRAAGVTESANQAAVTARSGAGVVEKTIMGMGRIRDVVGESAERMRQLEQVSVQIGEISQVISAIAEQTNLLALNAAIEAARAGEHGRGFAVVAEEVRKLAERSAASAREIGDLINNIQTRTTEAVAAMEAGTAEVEQGSHLAADAGRALAEILQVVEQAVRDVQEIAVAAQEVRANAERVVQAFDSVAAITEENTAATEEMAAGATEVVRQVERVAAVAQENAAGAEEVSAAVEELNASAGEVSASAQQLARIAEGLRQQLARFRI